MVVVDVVHQVLQELKELVALGPATHQLLGQEWLWREALVLGGGEEGGGRQAQGPPRAQRQEELEGAGDAIQVAQWLEVLGRGRAGLVRAPLGQQARTPVPCGWSCVPLKAMSQS